MLWLEGIAVLLGLSSVTLMARQNPLAWPIGLAMVVLYSLIFAQTRLYSEMLLQLIYAVLQLYGWWQWLYGGAQQQPRRVTRLPAAQMGRDLLLGALISLLLGGVMVTLTDARLPWVDAALTGFSLVAQWWMAQKRVQCWNLWLLLDLLYVLMFSLAELYLTAGLYLVFCGLALYGKQQWRKELTQCAS